MGVARVKEIATEQGYKEARTFRSASDLPDNLQQAHQQAIADKEGLLDES